MKQSENSPQNKVLFGKNYNNSFSPSFFSGEGCDFQGFALLKALSGQLKKGAERGRERDRHRKERKEKKKMAQRLSPDRRQGDFPGRNPGRERLPEARRRATQGLRCPLLGGRRSGEAGVPGKGV